MNNTQLLQLAITATIKAGNQILTIYNDPKSDFSIEKKADNSPLTKADKASHHIIEEILSSSKVPLLSEEGRSIEYAERKNWKQFWLVDPLDGTKEFIKRNGEFTVNIALVKSGIPVLGVIYIPVTKTLYLGEPDSGAWKMEGADEDCNLEKIKSSGLPIPKENMNEVYTLAGSRSHMSAETEIYIEKIRNTHKEIDFISKGSSIKICMVAEGAADEYPRFGPTMEWDTAAGHAIANAAGKKLWLSDFSGELKYNKENLLNPYFIVK